ncbi:putative repressor-like protein [uncultured Caudovirales phage]|uniref:Putative repressor-like protein n=1 Tax=uncultured Caudovirales phage TaxID=2100421 RepID=A0A2H4J4X9_9CAUD|nr:putative repressor-like protein [uncultured Caudovirales phage]
MSIISERIQEALYAKDMKQSDLVEKTGISKSSISTYISGAFEPKQKNLYKIAKALNVDPSWLIGNDVPMDMEGNGLFSNYELASFAVKIRNDLEAQQLLKIYYNELTKENRKLLIEIAKGLSGN